MSAPLLFLSPVLPDPEGTGPARRAWVCLRELGKIHEVTLLVATAPWHGRLRDNIPPPPCAECVEMVHDPSDPGFRFRRALATWKPVAAWVYARTPEDWIYLTGHLLEQGWERCPRKQFSVIHAFRLVMAPWALEFSRRQGGGARLQLDLDDVESSTRLRIADLEERNGAMVEAARVRREARAYERMERKYLGRFSRVYVCSATDRDRLKRWGFGSRILPNTVAVPDPMTRRPVDGLFRFGFIGSLGYSPNRDAVFRLCRDIWPALRQEGGCELVVAGHAPDPEIRSLVERTPGAVLQGNVARSGDFMARCQALLVPLRAGGGTRLKLLEAFAAGCPVVCTGLGAEGLELEDGVEFLRAETDGDFVHQAVRLKKDPGLADALAGAAFRLVRERNGPQALALALGES